MKLIEFIITCAFMAFIGVTVNNLSVHYIEYLDSASAKDRQESLYWADAALICPTWQAAKVNR